MNINDFKAAVDCNSADLSRWTPDDMRAGLALMATSVEAKRYFDQALALDAALRLAGHQKLRDTTALESRIMQAIAHMPQDAADAIEVSDDFTLMPFIRSLKPAWLAAPGGGLLAAAVIGFFIGFNPQHMQAEASDDFLLDSGYAVEKQVIAGDRETYILNQDED